MKKILFNSICKSTNYLTYTKELYGDYDLFRGKYFSSRSLEHLSLQFQKTKLFLTRSEIRVLEMIAHLINIQKGDEIIMNSFPFYSKCTCKPSFNQL